VRRTRALGASTIRRVHDLTRSQLLVYGAVAAALVVVGARWVLASGGGGSSGEGVSYASSGGGGGSGAGGSGGGSFSAGPGGEDVVVDVTGEVADAGVYRMPEGSRVNDALTRAGGATARASLEAINLAARLTDGQQVVVPASAESVGGVGVGTTPGAAVAGGTTAVSTAPISLGSATVADLDTIDGIGPVTAQKIVEFRDQQGGVSSVDDLSQISGIGPATMESLRARLQP
jgi:competence protein ComEA